MDITLDERWAIMGKIHGGYLLREIVTPLLTQAHPHPFAVSATFVRSPDGGPATVESETLRVGRRISQHRSRLEQGGQVCVEVLVTTGRHDEAAEPFWVRHEMPQLADPEGCSRAPSEAVPGFRVGHLDFVEARWDPAQAMAGSVEKSEGRVACWLRMDGRQTSVADLLVLADAMPPVTLDMGLAGWVPTIELSVLVRDLPAPGWLVAEQRTRLMQDGWLEEDCDIWDSRGRLVCQARQLAGYRLPS